MRKQVLVIGGSYFAGRVFSILTSRGEDLHLHVVNRGRYPLNLPNVTQYICDRHEPEKLAEVLPNDIIFDAVVDFCGYEPTEVSNIIEVLPGRIKQYIFLSTSSVYTAENISEKKVETDPMLHEFSSDAVSEYILKKCLLELETTQGCKQAGIPYTILRPAFIYGPFNYAPRESYFIQLIANKQSVPVPTDATSKFNFVYVMDVSDIINLCIANEKAYNEVFNLAASEDITYDSFIAELERCNGTPFDKIPVTVEQVYAQNIPLPYPLDVDELYSGTKVEEVLGYKYTPFSAGMDKTFKVFMDVYTPRN